MPTAFRSRSSALPLNREETVAVLVPNANMVKSAQYAVARLKDEGALPAETDIPVYHLSSMTVGDLKNLVQNTRHIIAVSASYSVGSMDPAAKAGADTALIDTVIVMAHAAGNDVTVISAHLPYDAAHYTAADAVVIAYGARGMSEDPRDRDGGVSQYGPNVPAALYLILSGREMTGTLPVSIPKIDENGRFTDEILYPAGYSVPVAK